MTSKSRGSGRTARPSWNRSEFVENLRKPGPDCPGPVGGNLRDDRGDVRGRGGPGGRLGDRRPPVSRSPRAG
jgi:hypothetical protein